MATTKIWPIHDNLKRVVNYANNPTKTELDNLKQVLHYATEDKKVSSADEHFYFVTGVNCHAETAYEDMHAIKERFGKTSGNVACHAYQSYKPGEVTPEKCHEIGVQLAKKLWGKQFQVLVATHLDKGHLHNHLVVNSVSFIDGKKFNCSQRTYWEMRRISDLLCSQNNLSVIKNPKGRTPRNIYFAEKNGEATKYNLMREAIDTALKISSTKKDFATALRDMGHYFSSDPNRKYATIQRIGDKKPVRLYHLGDKYNIQRITERINDNFYRFGYYLYKHEQKPYIAPQPKQYVFCGNFKTMKKVGGFRGLYLHYCYLLGVLPKRKNPTRPLSPQLREAVRHLRELSNQTRLICSKKLSTVVDVSNLINSNTQALAELKNQRDNCYNRLRRCTDPEIIAAIKAERDAISANMMTLRKENKLAESLPVRAATMREDIKIEQQMRAEMRSKQQKNKTKNKERGLIR